jgi:hypothetical protein
VRVQEVRAIIAPIPHRFWRAVPARSPELPKLSEGRGCEGMDGFRGAHTAYKIFGKLEAYFSLEVSEL